MSKERRQKPPKECLAYTIPELADAVGCSVDYIYKEWREKRGPKKTRLGKRVVITRENAKLWLDNLEIEERENG